METLIAVQYDNDHYGEHENYTTTLEEFLDMFWYLDPSDPFTNDVKNDLATVGKSTISNGYATTIATLIGEKN